MVSLEFSLFYVCGTDEMQAFFGEKAIGRWVVSMATRVRGAFSHPVTR